MMKNQLQKIWALFKKDLLLEIRQQYAFYGVLLYVVATIFVLFLVIENPSDAVWNGLFWVLQLFISINAVAKSFLQESRGRMLYYHSISDAQSFILSKLFFNSLLMLLMSLLSLVVYSFFLHFPVIKTAFFIGTVFLGSWSLSMVFTFLAAVAAKAQQNAAIMAILGFPVIIPLLIVLVKISAVSFNQFSYHPLPNILLILAFDFLIVVLSLILFPFLWND